MSGQPSSFRMEPKAEQMEQNEQTYMLHLAELEQGTHRFLFTLDSAYFRAIEKSEITGGDISAEAVLRLRLNDYDLHIKAAGTVNLICDRCLGDMDYAIDVEDDILPEDSDETEATDTIDLRWLTYEMITTHLPLVHSHPDGECMSDMQKLLQTHLCSTVEEPEML